MAHQLPDCLIGVEAADIFEQSDLSLVKRHVDEIIEEGLGNFMVLRAYRVTADGGPSTVLGDLASVGTMIEQLRKQKATPVEADSPAVEALRYACERGIHCAALYSWFTPEAVQQIKRECGSRFLFPMLGEMHGGMGEEMGQLADEFEAADLPALDRKAVEKMRISIEKHRNAGFARVGHVDGPIHHRLGYRAGLHVSMTELMIGFVQLHLAATRGAAYAFGKEFGSWIAMGYFGGANADVLKPTRLRASLNASYLSGAKYILLESGQWALHEHGNNVPEGNHLTRELRHEVKRFYAFAKRHPRPAPRPEVRLGLVKGRYDGWSGSMSAGVVWRQMHGAPEYLAGSPERGWDYVDVIWPGKGRWDTYPLQDSTTPWLLGTPYGQADLVPVEASAERLAEYRTLMFLGWNTMDAAQWRKLTAYVEQGGTLFMAVPQLATATRRPAGFTNPTDMKLIRGGKVEDLFGVRIKGCGGYHDRMNFTDIIRAGRIGLPVGRRFIMHTALFPAVMETAGARVLARSHDKRPLLTEHRVGKGTAYLLGSWDYPGLNTYQELMRVLVGRFAEDSMGDIRVHSDGPIDWAVYRGEQFDTVYLLNTHLEKAALASLIGPRGLRLQVQLDPSAMRVAYVLRDAIVCFESGMTALTGARRRRGWELDVEGARPVGVKMAFASGLRPRDATMGDEKVTAFGFTYPYYTLHFNAAAGTLRIRTGRAG